MEKEPIEESTGVSKANENNSTDFTNCCGVAVNVDDADYEYHCPGCGKKIIK